MSKEIFSTCTFLIKKPADCSDEEIEMFHSCVLKGGKVLQQGLKERVKNCELLGFCYYNRILVGTSSIKRPAKTYIEGIIEKAKLKRTLSELAYEIGYSYTESEFRRNGISKELKRRLLIEMKNRKGIVFSTTAIKSSQNFLEESGFVKAGEPYDGDNDKNIRYYEKILG